MYKQRGVSLGNMLLWAIVLGVAALTGLKLMPAYNEFFAVKRSIESVARDKAGAPLSEIREAFDRHATIEYITSVKGSDLEIVQDNNGTVISVNYQKIVPLVANVSFMVDFEAASKPAGKAE